MGIRMVRADSDGGLGILDRLVEPALPPEQDAQVVKRVGMIRTYAEDLLETGDRSGFLARGLVGNPEIVVESGIVRIQVDRSTKQIDSELVLAALMCQHT